MTRASAGAVSHRPSGAPKRARNRICWLRAMTTARSGGDSRPDGEIDRARRPAASRQLERDPAAERVADQRRPVQAEAVQLGLDCIGQAAWGWSDTIGQRRAFTEAREIDRDDVVAVLEGVEHGLPGAPAEPQPMHQHERLPTAAAVARQCRRAGGVGASGVLTPTLAYHELWSSSSSSSVVVLAR